LLPSAEEQKLAQAQSKYIKTKVNTSHCVKKAEEARAALRKVHRLRAKREAEVADIRREMAELEAAWRSYERGMQEDGASGGLDIQLREEQVGLESLTFCCSPPPSQCCLEP